MPLLSPRKDKCRAITNLTLYQSSYSAWLYRMINVQVGIDQEMEIPTPQTEEWKKLK